jgi:hypothetical protein
MFAVKLCKEVGCKMIAWSGGVCKNHIPKKALRSTPKPANNNDRILKMQEFFLSIWKQRAHKSEVSGTYLGSEPMSTFFHHILPKEKYPQACFDEENIILLTLDEHTNVESDMYKYPEVNKRREQLKLKYEIE